MYQIFCDLCGQKRAKDELRGICSAGGEYIHLTSDKAYSKKITECDCHICTECLGKLDWKSEPAFRRRKSTECLGKLGGKSEQEKDETGDNQ